MKALAIHARKWGFYYQERANIKLNTANILLISIFFLLFSYYLIRFLFQLNGSWFNSTVDLNRTMFNFVLEFFNGKMRKKTLIKRKRFCNAQLFYPGTLAALLLLLICHYNYGSRAINIALKGTVPSRLPACTLTSVPLGAHRSVLKDVWQANLFYSLFYRSVRRESNWGIHIAWWSESLETRALQVRGALRPSITQ